MATQCTPDTPIRGPSLSKPDVWIRYIRDRGGQRMDEVANFVRETYRLAAIGGISAHLIVGQAIHETGMFTSTWWVARLNPGGLDIIGDRAHDLKSRYYPNGTVAARAMMVHVCLYVLGELPGEIAKYRHEDPRADEIPDDALGHRTTLGQFGHAAWWEWVTWAADDDYGVYWAARMNAAAAAGVFDQVQTPPAGDGTGGPGKEPIMIVPVGMKAHRFVGLDVPVLLPVDIEVIIDIVPDRFIGWVRSGQRFTGQTKTTFHDTGAPGQNARSQRNYLHNGPSENGQRRQVGFNFAVDDKVLYQLTPLNEVTWAAGTPEGNRTSWHVEQCFGPGIDWDRSLRNAIALHAGLIAAKGWSTDTALVKHQHWFGKWCPAQVLNRGLWPSVVSRVDAAAKAITGGQTAATVSVRDLVATTTELNLREAAGLGGAVLTVLAAGTELEVIGGPTQADGYTWWQLKGVDLTGWAAEGAAGTPYLVVTKDYVEEEPETPTYAKPLAIAELAKWVGRPIVPMAPIIALGDGVWAVPTYDRVRALRDTPRRQQATGDARVGPDIHKGEEFDVSFLVLGETPHYVTSWWTRITAADVEIISDVPRDLPAAEGVAA